MGAFPVLEGTLAARARRAGLALSVRLRAAVDELGPHTPVGLARGSAGLALALACVDDGDRHAAMRALAHARAHAAATSWGLFDGRAGVAWASTLLEHPDHDAFDRELVRVTKGDRVRALDRGLAGLLVHASAGARSALAHATVLRLCAAIEPRAIGATWSTLPEHLSDEQRTRAPQGCEELGVARGVAGIVAALALAARSHPELHDRAAQACGDALAWLRATPAPPRGRIAAWIDRDGRPHASIDACEVGVAVATLACARTFGLAREETWACALLHEAIPRLRREPPRDHSLRRGLAAIALAYQRAAVATGNLGFLAFAREQYARLLHACERDTLVLGDRCGLLDGAAGVALALHAATTEALGLPWDRLLLVEVPARAQTGASAAAGASGSHARPIG